MNWSILASAALQRQCGIEVETESEVQDLITLNRLNVIWVVKSLNRLDEILVVKSEDPAMQISAVTTRSKARSGVRSGSNPSVLCEEVIRELRIERIRQTQDEEAWIHNLNKYLVGEIRDLTQEEARPCGSITMNYEVDQHDLLIYCPTTKETAADRDKLCYPKRCIRMSYTIIIPVSKVDIKGSVALTIGSGIIFTGEDCIEVCKDMSVSVWIVTLEKGDPGSRANRRIIDIDNVPSLPRSYKGNPEMLIFEDLFSGYVIVKASGRADPGQLRPFGASEVIHHDRELGSMSDFFRAFNKILDQCQRTTMAYIPQANGFAERMVQTTTRTLKMYVQDLDQRDWDEYAVRLTFAINTARDRIRGETPFYMVHGWDPRWERHYQQAREQVNRRLREGIADRADQHNDIVRPHQVEVGSRVWLYLDRVREGYAKKLAHLWHGPFRVVEKIGEYAVKLEIAGSAFHISPIDQDRLDFDEALLPGHSWIQVRDPDEYEVERISDMRTGRKTIYSRILREFLVHWRGTRIRLGSMRQISTVERYSTNFCGIVPIRPGSA
ncbi:reverse transcriptase [Phytophthora megakarya]|uniref:Reverse transcriptase n=1 Tax=Phytophthora megakarya TaxID=4795 RepID=A0A225W2G2_9STRA|nr:reverse transcriptase [Phytophthora megakarya]